MKKLLVLVALAALSFGAMAEEAKKAKAPAKAPAGKAVMWATDELKWIDPPNAPPGVKMAVLWGDPEKGAHGAMHKFPAGFTAPLHHHTADHNVVVVSGTVVLTPEGGEAKKLPAGSYFSFTGKKKHTTACDAGSDCVLMVDCKGKWDVVMEEKKK
ncbi:MAG TPA: DUF4437 domain-containing protein [Thermoanaerobaculia bacterium]|jgi:quercetin dioxygenase-like cupin family protein|nr:DUF4437 domain-containing protein [Thermoanaerobaculia bacterium]